MAAPLEIEELDTGTLTAASLVPVQTAGATHQVAASAFITDAASFLQSGSGAEARTVQEKLRDSVSVKDFGAVGDGTADDTAALQAAIDVAKAEGRSVFFPTGTYNYSSLDLDDILDGVSLVGESPAGPGASIGDCSALRCTATGSGVGISVASSHNILFKNLALSYNSASYTGDLVSLDHSAAAVDVAFVTFQGCWFTGEGSADNANSLLKLNKAICTRIRECTFSLADKAIITGTSYVVVLGVEDCEFQQLTTKAVYLDGTGGCESLSFLRNTFENLVSGKAAAFDSGATVSNIKGLTFVGNWFGDVSTAGGLYWINAPLCLGVSIQGNMFGTAGAGAGDYAIRLDACQGVAICGNRFDSKALNIAVSSSGVVVSGNDLSVGSTAIAVTGTQPIVFGNTGFTDTHGGTLRLGGIAGPTLLFNPSSGATTNGSIFQSGDILTFADSGVASKIQIALTTGKLWPATDAGAAQTAAGIFAGSGAPNDANGANGDFYFRSDGTVGADTAIYHKEAGAWVACTFA